MNRIQQDSSMKKVLYFIGIAAMSALLACGPTSDDAVNLNNRIVKTQQRIHELEDTFAMTLIGVTNIKEIETSHKAYIDSLQKFKKEYEDMSAFDKKDIFRTALLDYINVYTDVAQKEYKDLIKIVAIPVGDRKDSDYTRWEEITKQIDEKEAKANDAFLDAQKAFADDYGFKLVEK